jgi:hypothetical protein
MALQPTQLTIYRLGAFPGKALSKRASGSSIDHRSRDCRHLIGRVWYLLDGNFRIGGDTPGMPKVYAGVKDGRGTGVILDANLSQGNVEDGRWEVQGVLSRRRDRERD